MKQALTVKLKLMASPEQKELLRAMSLAYRDAMNYASQTAFDLDKTSNANTIQKAIYQNLREDFGLPAQSACSVCRYVGATYKTLWSLAKANAKANKQRIAEGKKPRIFKGLNKPARFSSRTTSYQYGKDYSFKIDQQVSILTLQGRVVIPYLGYNKHIAYIRDGAQIGAAKLWYDKPTKTYYLLVSIEIDVADPSPEDHKSVVGVDLGTRYLAAATDMKDKTTFVSGKKASHVSYRYQKTRKRLKRKGTRSATRRLIERAKRERRHKRDINHKIACQVLAKYPNSVIGVEDLKGVRERTNCRRSKKASKKQRKANHKQSKWSFAEVQSILDYKAVLNGSLVIKVDADYTSQACPVCGYASKSNRPNKGLLFRCVTCGFELHADLVGARNIALRALLIRQDWMSTGILSSCPPDASDCEAKAERLKRYSELRWSSDASPRL